MSRSLDPCSSSRKRWFPESSAFLTIVTVFLWYRSGTGACRGPGFPGLGNDEKRMKRLVGWMFLRV